MRRFLVPLFAILIVAATGTALYFKFKRARPTPFNWQASVFAIAGDGSPSFRDVAKAREAGLSDPFGIAVSRDGVVYFSDSGEGNRIRKLTVDGKLTNLAGGTEGFSTDRKPSYNTPSGLAIDADGNILVADTGNNRIRKVTPQGVVTTVAGNGMAGLR